MEPRWQFEVRETCRITGRGLALFGSFLGAARQREPAIAVIDGAPVQLPEVRMEFALTTDGEEVALLVPGGAEGSIPVGTMIRSLD